MNVGDIVTDGSGLKGTVVRVKYIGIEESPYLRRSERERICVFWHVYGPPSETDLARLLAQSPVP